MKKKKTRVEQIAPQKTNEAVEAEVSAKTPVPEKENPPAKEEKPLEKIGPQMVENLKKSLKSAKADSVNTEKALQKIQYERDLKWRYPEDCIETSDRKVFRSKSRNKIRRLEAAALKLDGDAKALKMKEIEAARKELLVNPETAV